MDVAERERVIAAYRSTGGQSGEVSAVTAVGPMQVVLRTLYETRRQQVTFEPTTETAEGVTEVPVAHTWDLDYEAKPGPEKQVVRLNIRNRARVMECPPCGKSGTAPCSPCGGTGSVPDHRPSAGDGETRGCFACHSTGSAQCAACAGSGFTQAVPLVIVETGMVVTTRVLEVEELPVELLIEIGDRTDDGKVVYSEEGSPLPPHRRGAGYRGEGARVSPAVDEKVAELLAEAPFPGRVLVHNHQLDVLQVPVYRLELAGGHVGWAYGKPLAAWGEKRSKLPFVIAAIALIGAAAAGFYFLM